MQKKADATKAFEIIANKTILSFHPVQDDEEIFVSCENKQEVKGNFFIAGEGGPVNITKSGDFNIISYGEVSLIRQSECQSPNIAMHEILHALGFNHSINPNNIMYNISSCSQTMGQDIPRVLEKIYSIQSYPDLLFDEVLPLVHGKYLDANISIKNNGIIKSGPAKLDFYRDDVLVNTISLKPLEKGFGMKLTIKNMDIKSSNFKELTFVINGDFNELDEGNNKITFDINE